MIIEKKIKVIEKSTRAYQFEGKAGTSRKVRAIIEDDIFPFSFNEDQLNVFNSLPEKGEVNVKIHINSPKEQIKMSIVEIVTK